MTTFFTNEDFDKIVKEKTKQKKLINLNAIEARIKLAKTKLRIAQDKRLKTKKIKELADSNYFKACIELEQRSSELCKAFETFIEAKKND